MGGGKGGGGGGGTPGFVREGTQRLAERSQQLFDISRPLLETGTSQIASLISTGGPGARVPIINQAVTAQNAANRQVQRDISGDLRRAGLERGPIGTPGGIRQIPGRPSTSGATTSPVSPSRFQQASTPFSRRIRSEIGRRGAVEAGTIPIRAALPLQTSAIAGALSGGRQASAGFQGGLSALATGARVGEQARIQAQQARREAGLNLGRNLFRLTQAGGFNFLRDPLNNLFSSQSASGIGVDSPAFAGFTPSPIQGGLPF